MSREFGSDNRGYLHTQMLQASEDCAEGRDKLTQLFSPFFKHLYDIMYAICSSEASDSGPEVPILKAFETLPLLRGDINIIEDYLSDFKRVIKLALEAECQKEKSQK